MAESQQHARPAAEAAADAATSDAYVPTSVALERLIAAAPADEVRVDWVVNRLDQRSFGLMMLVLGVFGLIPGITSLAGILLLFPAVQMILGREHPALPNFVAGWRIRTARLQGTLAHVRPLLQRMERIVHPRWLNPFGKSRRLVGIVVLLLAITMLPPVPLFHIVPASAIILISFAYLEEDGLLLALGMAAAAISLAVTGVTVWGALHATGMIEDAL
ncbi:MAG: exopolysaccharide biosynthesis protein [Rhodospirillaceae bacterium]|nr:exopolysaccharide biosynthesis protein [Rhodospirillaceae bacterium]